MANIKSQIKRNRQAERARVRNRAVRTSLRTQARKVREAVEAGDRETAETQLRELSRSLDKAASKGVIHPRRAADRKRRLAHTVASAADAS